LLTELKVESLKELSVAKLLDDIGVVEAGGRK
jgi:hypothetical protein